jgi:hypothetical protein
MPGLCLTCDNRADCVHRKHRGYHAVYCELFQQAPTPEANPGAFGPQSGTGDEATDGSQRWGLCFDCKKRDSCALSDAEGGVWVCADYQ